MQMQIFSLMMLILKAKKEERKAIRIICLLFKLALELLLKKNSRPIRENTVLKLNALEDPGQMT